MVSKKFEVQVVYAKPAEQLVISIGVDAGATLVQAVQQSGVLDRYPEIEIETLKAGIFGKAAGPDTVLSEGDRVEIYRPLIADPKEARKKRAAEGKPMKKGGG